MTTIEKLYPAIRGHRITTDSRQIIRGDIFIALKGENFDGNRYAAAALEQGAALAIIDNADYLSPGCELVADSLLFLQQLAHYHRQQLHIPILGITGTNGKTTTKELCHAVLSKKFKTFATQGNFNNHIGVPLTLLSMDETTEFGIVEMGANHQKENMGLATWKDAPRGKIQKFDVAVAKNYLSEIEMQQLQRLVSAYLDLAEDMALRQIPLTMEDWETRLNRFIEATDREILQNAGKVTAEIAKAHAETEFEKYRIVQDNMFESDFDKMLNKQLPNKEDQA